MTTKELETTKTTDRRPTKLALAGLAVATAGWLAFRRWHTHWGATPEEASASLPGDELFADANVSITHAITIEAPPHCVWPWLAQLGQNKGGFYSYVTLENLVGCEMPTVETIRDEWQNTKVGDAVSFHPKFPTATIAQLARERHLVLQGEFGGYAYTWAFVIRECGYGSSRLIVRFRSSHAKGLERLREEFVSGPAHFIMERKMMLTIKHLAEELAAKTKAPVDEQC